MRKVMIVDDDQDDIDFLCEAIENIDPSIRRICVSDGIHALELLFNEEFVAPDFIFLDLNMPRLGGKQCLERIKKVERLREIPVIIYTTSKLRKEITDTMKMGAVHFLTKPTKLNELEMQVSSVLNYQWEKLNQ